MQSPEGLEDSPFKIYFDGLMKQRNFTCTQEYQNIPFTSRTSLPMFYLFFRLELTLKYFPLTLKDPGFLVF